MLTWVDHLLVAVLAAFFPIWAAVFGTRRLRRASPQDLPRIRLSTYRRAMAMLWTLAAVVVVSWIVQQRSFAAIGLVPRPTFGLLGVALGAAIVAILLVRERNQTLADDEALARVRERLGYVEPVLPHSRAELRSFYRLSVSAGVCEELLYRGFLTWYLTHWLEFWPAVGVASVLFGLGHSYQGPRGMLLTAVVGLFFAAVYWVTGSLLAPMVLHAAMDIHSGHLAHAALERARVLEEAARARELAEEEARARELAEEEARALAEEEARALAEEEARAEEPAGNGEAAHGPAV